MTYVTSHSGVRMPAIVYGTAWKKEQTAGLVRMAIEHGFRGIDTACQPKHYDERGVGEGVAACAGAKLERADLYLQTKFTPVDGQEPQRIPYDPRAPLPEQVAQSLQVSLRNLQTSYVDSLVLHSPLASSARTLQAWRAMEALVDSGGAKQIGISNCYSLEQLQRLCSGARIMPAVVQNRFYAQTGYDTDIRAFCRERSIIYQSFWTLTANPHVLEDPDVQALATAHERTPAQILFRYLTQMGVVPLTGTRSPAHMSEDLAIFDFELQPRELAAMDALFEG